MHTVHLLQKVGLVLGRKKESKYLAGGFKQAYFPQYLDWLVQSYVFFFLRGWNHQPDLDVGKYSLPKVWFGEHPSSLTSLVILYRSHTHIKKRYESINEWWYPPPQASHAMILINRVSDQPWGHIILGQNHMYRLLMSRVVSIYWTKLYWIVIVNIKSMSISLFGIG